MMFNIQNTRAMLPIIMAAVALPEPVSLGLASIILFAVNAFEIAIGPKIKPRQKRPIIE